MSSNSNHPYHPELAALCREFSADGSLDVSEISALWQWVCDHPDAVSCGLPLVLSDRLNAAWLDGHISTGEAFELLDLTCAVAAGLSLIDYEERMPAAVTGIGHSSAPSPSKLTHSSKPLDVVHFTYRNSNGEVSQRRVLVRELADRYLMGVCLLRGSVRTFRLDRVVGELVSEETGEIAESLTWASGLDWQDRSAANVRGADRKIASGPGILFTGFSAALRAELEQRAEVAGMVVRKSVSKTLDYLVAGPNAGPAKLVQAHECGAVIMSLVEFNDMRRQSA
ncbi:WYL domain-containing protein [Vogesella indigofera]|uniref:WYL domain-containing protein n=1 Tax=Vogesella indigofera TaxID=45465 RepID=UPI00234C5C29|nr:WYL domain-containing protein [Vogesella indigofera]MDC7704816.1 hypothetical protein [Vogesella indigofera]